MSILETIIIAIVEGLTEFLPVSSTGHMIIAQNLLGVESTNFVKMFTVNIQFGAILSIVILYWKRFVQSIQFYKILFVAFLPAMVFGLLAGDLIDSLLENVLVVSIMLILGGIIMLFVDKWFSKVDENQEIGWKRALKIGLFQCIAMIPGVSRSMASIVAGMSAGLNRKNAAEFSFFLAVPTMAAAAGYSLFKMFEEHGAAELLTSENIINLIIGNVIAFIVAMLAVKFFIGYITKYGFKFFGYYRIVIGSVLLVLLLLGKNLTII